MTRNDPLSDALSGIENAEDAGSLTYDVSPASNELGSVLDVFADHGYVQGYRHVADGQGGSYEVELHGGINACGAVTPRYAAASDEFERWEKRFLPARNYGSLVVSTSQGVLSHEDARAAGVGGQIIAYVY